MALSQKNPDKSNWSLNLRDQKRREEEKREEEEEEEKKNVRAKGTDSNIKYGVLKFCMNFHAIVLLVSYPQT